MGDSDLSTRSLASDLIRTIFSVLDRPTYWLLGLVYKLFFNVASAEILSDATIGKFYGRVQVILGVFMIFELAVVFLRAIAEPDSFSKDKGFGTLLTRVATSLIILTALMPMSIASPRNSYEKRIGESGLLFGTLYSLQDRILSNNTIGRLIMGSSASDSNYYKDASNNDTSKIKKAANFFTTTVLRGFYRVNLIPEESRSSNGNGDPAAIKSNRVCSDNDSDKVIQSYNSSSVTSGDIISMVNETCDVNDDFLSTIGNGISNIANAILPIKLFSGNKKYVFTYMPVISTIVGIVFVFIFLSFTIDVAVRTIKLAFLRLLAPIPVLAHIDPRGSKDTAFNAWVKSLTSTYLDLFIRLAVVYFVIFIIQETISHGITIGQSGSADIFTKIVIWIGLFVFAKQAPKFIKEMIGLKGDSFKLFGGIGEALGVGAAGAGIISSFNAARAGSRQSDIANNKPVDSFWNRGKHLIAGITGGITGGIAGAKAYAGAKDNAGRAVSDVIQKRNATKFAQGDAGSTFLGRAGASLSRTFLGETPASRGKREIANDESRQKALDAIKSRVSGEMVKMDWTSGTAGGVGKGYVDTSGVDIGSIRFNNKEFVNALEKARATGGDVVAVDTSGVAHTIDLKVAGKMAGNITKENEDSYIVEVTAGRKDDAELLSLIEDAMQKGGSGWDEVTQTYSHDRHNPITKRNDYTKTSEGLGQGIREAKRRNAKAEADDRFSNKK